MKSRLWISCGFAVACLSAAAIASSAEAQDDYPTGETIVFTSHSAPGGGTDIMGRNLIDALKAQNINAIIENRPGGSGYINMAYLASLPGDGYHLGTASRSHLIARYMANLPLSFRDFKPVARVVQEEYALVTSSNSKWQTVQELIDDMEARPGEIQVGGGSIGSPDSLIAFGLFQELGLEPQYVPYETSPEIAVGLLGDQLQLAVVNPPEAWSQIQSGDFRVLAVASEERSSHFPDAPTLSEVGIDVVAVQWLGVWAPKETPDDIVKKASEFIHTAMQEESFQNFIEKNLMIEAYLPPAEFEAAMAKDDAALEQLIDEMGLRGENAKK